MNGELLKFIFGITNNINKLDINEDDNINLNDEIQIDIQI